MKVDWLGLIRGTYNKVLGKEWIKEIAAKRYSEHCQTCDWNSKVATVMNKYESIRPDEHCIKCGCNIDLKTHDMAQVCPVKKWQAELSPEDRDKVEAILEKEDEEIDKIVKDGMNLNKLFIDGDEEE